MISSSQIKSVGAAVDYYTADRAELTQSSWGGRGAVLAGLPIGQPVDPERFRAALEGQIDGQQIQGGFSKTHGADYHRPGMDYTFSPSKSASVVGLVGGDERIIGAHQAAVSAAMDFLGGHAQARTGHGGADVQDTGNLLFAKFEHTTTRNDDPQIHTHVVILNATQAESGDWMALRNRPLLAAKREADEIYGRALGEHLQTLGYQTEPGKSGPEIKGITPDQRAAYSSRSNAIGAHLAKAGLTRESATSGQRQVANFATRPDKSAVPTEQLTAVWREVATSVGLDARSLSTKPQQLEPVQAPYADPMRLRRAIDAVARSMRESGAQFDKLAGAAGSTLGAPDRAALHAAHADQAPTSVTQLSRRVRAADPAVARAPRSLLDQALAKAVESGELHVAGNKYSAEPPAVHAQRSAVLQEIDARPTLERNERLAAAVDRVIDRMESAHADVTRLTVELADARNDHLKAHTDSAKRTYAAEVLDLDKQLHEAGKLMSLSLAQARREVRNEGVGLVTNHDLDAALQAAVAAGRLHQNVNKLSVEPEVDTDQRLASQRDDKKGYTHASLAGDRKARKAVAQEAWTNKREQSAAASSARREQRIELMTPAQQEHHNIRSQLGRMASGVLAVPGMIRHPWRTTGKVIKWLVVTKSIDAAAVTLAVGFAGVKAAAVQTMASIGGERARERAQAGIKKSTETLEQRGIVHAAKLDKQGQTPGGGLKLYTEHNSFVDVRRAKLSVSNVLLLTAAATINSTRLGSTVGGAVLRNELLLSVKTTRVNFAEAVVASTALATARFCVRHTESAIRWASHHKQDSGFTRADDAYKAAQADYRKAYGQHVKTTLDSMAGKASTADVEKSAANLAKCGAAAEKKHETLFDAATEKYDADRMSLKFYTSIVDHRNAQREAVSDFKAKGSITVDQLKKVSGANNRELARLDRQAGRDVLNPAAAKPVPWLRDTGASQEQVRNKISRESGEPSRAAKAKPSRDMDYGMSR